MKTPRRNLEPSAVELVEEAVHLLRRAPAATLAIYYAGTVPFALGLLYFWAHTTWFQPSGERVAWGALGVVGLFALAKIAQAEFCGRLLAMRLGAEPPAWSWPRLGRMAIAQVRLQSWTLLLWLPAALVAVPFGWCYAYAQNVTVLGEGDRLRQEAMEQAKLWPRQNHVGLVLLSALALAAAINLGTAFGVIPWLANRLLGIENIFGFTGWWYVNTTFLASVGVLTWLAVDPLAKAFYTLRVFHGRARATGEDIRVELQLAHRARRALRVGATLALLWLALPQGSRAAEPAPRPAIAVESEALDRAIDDVLTGADFSWRLRPPPAGADVEAADGPIKRFVRQGVDMLKSTLRAVGRAVKKFVDWLERRFSRDDEPWRPRKTSDGAGAISTLRVVLYGFIVVAVLAILWVVWAMVRQARRHATPLLTATAVSAATPDLRDENVQAAQLPADGWLALAREQAAKGEWRLALRAVYLATLARLAADGLVSLAKFKTNLDYERELRRRALSRGDVVTRFALRRRAFEDVWYGRAAPGEADVRAWMAELERPIVR